MREKPPKQIVLTFSKIDFLQKGDWFLAKSKGTIYQWLTEERSQEKHPIYIMTVSEN